MSFVTYFDLVGKRACSNVGGSLANPVRFLRIRRTNQEGGRWGWLATNKRELFAFVSVHLQPVTNLHPTTSNRLQTRENWSQLVSLDLHPVPPREAKRVTCLIYFIPGGQTFKSNKIYISFWSLHKENKLAKLRRCMSWVHFAKIHLQKGDFGKIHSDFIICASSMW